MKASHWLLSAAIPRFRRLDRDLVVDVGVVGGGITGVTAAYLLQKAGLKVALIDRARIGGVDTMSTTGHLTSVADVRLHKLASRFGRGAARAVWDAGRAATDTIERLSRTEGIDCDFQWTSGYLHCSAVRPHDSPKARDRAALKREALTAGDLEIPSHFLSQVPFWKVPGIHFPHQAVFHPRKYLSGLVRVLQRRHARIFEHTAAEEIKERPQQIRCGSYRIQCGHLVFATHTPLMGKTPMMPALLLQMKLFLYTSYAMGAKIPAESIPAALYWDTSDPYFYLRVERRGHHDYAIYGGCDHKTGQADEKTAFRLLKKRFLQFAPQAQFDSQWSGQVIGTIDGLPYIGETASRQFAATGFSGNGLTFGTLGGIMAADAILKRPNPWRDLFDIHRKTLSGGIWSYLRENKDYPYYFVRDWLAPSAGRSLRLLGRGQGKLLNLEGRKVAAYRDETGAVTLCSPVCTHLQCVVGWNEAEKTWDCPCHGSRFSPKGQVISGPAEEPLATLSSPKESS